MADGKVVISTGLDNSGIAKGIKAVTGTLGGLTKVVAGVTAGITSAFGAAAIAITKQAVAAYADYEQLAGGVETLFKDASSRVMDYAEDAFYTVGISANEYMETVTSFSASLISALGGDTAKAADVADMALTDMADNANKMGSSMESIKTAYQGFAKQNYTMLDNLKLGYGGTKTEMERLLKDAQAITGIKYDINNLADVYNAIHAVQEKLGIAGATAQEAEKTISGSASMTAAAWKNVLAAISGGGDIDRAINNLVYSVSKYFKNIVPVVQRALSGIGELIEKVAPMLVEMVASALIKALPGLINAVYQMIVGLAKGIYQGIGALLSGETKELSAQLNKVDSGGLGGVADSYDAITEAADESTEASKKAQKSLAGFDEIQKLGNDKGDKDEASSTLPAVGSDTPAATIPVQVELDGGNSSPIFQQIVEKVKGFTNDVRAAFAPSITAWKDAFSSIVPAAEGSASRVSAAWANLKDTTLVPFGQYIATNFVPGMVNAFSTTFAPIFADVMPVAIDLWTTDFENGCLVVQEACSILENVFKGVQAVFEDMCTSITTNWDTYGGDLLQGFTDFRDGLWEIWWYIYDNILDPVISASGETLSQLWDGHLKPLWDSIVEFALSVGENLLALWNGFIKPVVDYVVAYLAPIVTNVINGIRDAIYVALAWISDAIRGMLKTLDGGIQFITGVFTLDWNRAWGGIKKMFEGVWTSLSGTVKGVTNTIIWVINQLIAAIYSGIAGVVNGLGSIVSSVGNMLGKDWGFSIPTAAPKIPYLAQGAVLPPNKPFLAVVGDQKHGTNIEAPLSTIQEAVALVMEDMIQSNIAGHEAVVAVLKDILEAVLGIEIGDNVIGEAVSRYSAKMAIIRGGV